MSLKIKITEEIKVAMKAKDSGKLSILRVLKSEIERNEQSSAGKIDLSDADVIKIVKKMVDGVKETTNNTTELEILEAYLPQQLSEEKIREIIGSLALTNMGEIMKHFKTNFDGQYDGKLVSNIAKETA